MEFFINPGIARIAIIEVPIIEDLLYTCAYVVICRRLMNNIVMERRFDVKNRDVKEG